jgi:hypothetical protein
MENQFSAFIDDLKATHGNNLASVVLYGSAATGDFIPRRSDYNILIALHRITPRDLRNAHASVREWNRLGHPVPVYFTVSELQNAGDVFPIEFHQMQAARKVLYGRLTIDVTPSPRLEDLRQGPRMPGHASYSHSGTIQVNPSPYHSWVPLRVDPPSK